MQPAEGGRGGRTARRWAPVALVGVIGVVVLVALVVSSGDDGSGGESASGTGPTDTSSPSVDEVVTFSRAEAEGMEVAWPATCDTDRGRWAMPSNYAAECVAPFEGDNGGTTTPGVTEDTIRVVVYEPAPDPFVDAILAVIQGDDTTEDTRATWDGFVELFEAYYETYGRHVELTFFQATGLSADEVAARADAETIAAEYDPFAVIGGPFLTEALSDELAARGIIHISAAASYASGYYADAAPYLWSVLMTPDQVQIHLAEYIGKRLAGQPAVHAGDPEMQDRERVFGRVMLEIGPDYDQLQTQLVDELADYDVTFGADTSFSDPITLPTVAPQLIAEMKEAGVTTVVYLGDPLAPGTLTEVATAQDYFPEWLISGSYGVDSAAFARSYDQAQWANAFGPSGLFARGTPESSVAYGLYDWFHDSPPPADSLAILVFGYSAQLYAGIQAAGPDITPGSFEAGLFASPPREGGLTSAATSWGNWHWPVVDHAALDDMTELWWDPEASGPDELGNEGRGMYQYVEGGERHLPGGWPDTPPQVFDLEGAVTIYEELPPGDVIGTYPPPDEDRPPSHRTPAGSPAD